MTNWQELAQTQFPSPALTYPVKLTPAAPGDISAVSPYGTRWTKWIRPAGLSLLLIFLDALGVYAFLIGAFLIMVYLPRSLLAEKYAACRKERLIRFVVYLAAVGTVLSLIPINRQIAEERAERIIAAVENYKAANGRYPDRLDQLVPQFIAVIPAKARATFTDSGFRYFAGESHTLMYVAMPPFGRRTYNFETKSWGFMD
ncbi:MAG: hypothetical protein NTV11_17775 [Rhodocyclales bacterium]|nr:hypothetical protein [Rhodocyclales bacterium]